MVMLNGVEVVVPTNKKPTRCDSFAVDSPRSSITKDPERPGRTFLFVWNLARPRDEGLTVSRMVCSEARSNVGSLLKSGVYKYP